MICCALVLPIIGGSSRFTLYDEYSYVGGISAKAFYTCGRKWTGDVYATAKWPSDGAVSLNTKEAIHQSCPIAVAVNDVGDVVAQLNLGTLKDFNSAGFRWLHDGEVQRLKTFTDKDQCLPRAISRDGSQIIGTIFGTDRDWPAVWRRDGSIVRLPPKEKPLKSFGEALGMSGNGRVIVGHLGSESEGQRAVTWTDSGPPRKLGDLAKSKFQSYAWVANFQGSIVAGYSKVGGRCIPVRWIGAAKPLPLGTMPSRYDTGMARGISDDGKVIVGLWGTGESGQGFVWTEKTGAVSAAEFLTSHGLGAQVSGLKLTVVIGVTADGHTIAGECFDAQHHMHGFRATF
ncbi:MAG: hypothetical protein ACHQ50_04040 [Fimbriimonadales bacterium]